MIIRTICKIILITIVSFTVFSFLSCAEDGQSIFWTIINAQEEEDYSLNNNISILSMTDDGTNYYIATGGSIFWQEMSLEDNEWEKIAFPEDAVFCTSLECIGSSLYAGFLFEDNPSLSGLYVSSDPANSPDWTLEDDADLNEKQIVKIMEVNGVFFISLQEPRDNADDPFTYSLYYDNAGNYESVNNLTNIVYPVVDIASDTTEFIMITGSDMYKGAIGTMTQIEDDPSVGLYNGIFYITGTYYASSDNGYIYTSSDGDNWDPSDVEEISGETVSFTGFAEINGNIVVGTRGYGFYEMRDGLLDSLKRAGRNTDEDPVDDGTETLTGSDLYTSCILSFYLTTADTVFFCTGGSGLYHNEYNGSLWSDNWVRE